MNLPNSPLLEEVINFVNEGKFLQGVSSLPAHNYLIERDYDKAQYYAFTQLINHANLCWQDIKEHAMGSIYGKGYENYSQEGFKAISEQLDKMGEDFFKPLKKRVSRDYSAIVEEIFADMFNSLYNRSVNGPADNFYERIFQIYQAGGWPCGWIGNYPEGKMIVFCPPNEEQA